MGLTPNCAIILVLATGAACRPTDQCNTTAGDASPSAQPVELNLKMVSVSPIPTTYPYNHASSIIESPDGDLLCAWGAGTTELAPDQLIVLSRRKLGESEWSAPVIVADRPDQPDANPVLFADDAGTIHLYYVEMFGPNFCLGRVMERVSTDNAATWSAPRDALGAVCTMIRNHILVAKDGRWVLPAYQQAIYQSQFWVSADRGQTWSATAPLLTLTANNLQPAVVELADGSFYALMRTSGGNNETWEGRSSDSGKSWQVKQRPELPNPNSGLDLIRLATGHLLMVHNPSKTERTPLSITVSPDEGVSWSAPFHIAEGPPQLSYPSACQARNGQIHITYSDRLERITHAVLTP